MMMMMMYIWGKKHNTVKARIHKKVNVMLKGQRNLMKSARYKYIRQMSAKVQ